MNEFKLAVDCYIMTATNYHKIKRALEIAKKPPDKNQNFRCCQLGVFFNCRERISPFLFIVSIQRDYQPCES